MASFWDKVRQGASSTVSKVGTALRLPEMNISERIAPKARAAAPAPTQMSSPGFIGPTYRGPQGNVLGSQTSVVTGGGSVTGGQGSAPTQSYDQGALMEGMPDAPQIDFNAVFAPAFEALTQQETAAQSGYTADVAGIEQGTAARKQGLQSEQTNRLAQFGQQRTEATGQTESAVSSARRQAAEILQGIQAHYGGTTGTGKFQSEILGGQATQNIATNQAALQNTLGKIGQSENNLKTEVMNLISQEDQKLETQKLQLRAQLQQSLADVGKERGRLESEKAQMRIDTLNQYQQVLAGINQRNTAFKQTLFRQTQEAQNELEKLRAKAQETSKVNLTTANLSQLVSSGSLTAQQAQQVPLGTNVAGQSLEDILGVATNTQQPDDTLNSALGLPTQ